jgi:hypothetical protein
VNRVSELVLADVDWTMIKSWARAERARQAEERAVAPYRLCLRGRYR